MFGTECSFYQLNKEFDMPSDAQRMNHIIRLVHEGYEEKILISQDIHTKHRLVRWFLYSLPRGNVNSQKPRQRYAGCIVHFFLIAMEFVIIVIRQSNIIKKIKRFTKIRTKSQNQQHFRNSLVFWQLKTPLGEVESWIKQWVITSPSSKTVIRFHNYIKWTKKNDIDLAEDVLMSCLAYDEYSICIFSWYKPIYLLNFQIRFGGHGYSHIINNILPRLKSKGLSSEQIEKISIQNPAKWLQIEC